MKKYAFFWLFVTLTTVFLSGCGGRWCTADNGYCFEGFNGPSRVQSFQYGVYYPYSELIMSSSLKKSSCYINAIINGVVEIDRLDHGDYTRIKVHNNPGETRNVTVLVQKYCGKKGKEKYVSAWEHSFRVSANEPISATWLITDAHFQKNAFVWR